MKPHWPLLLAVAAGPFVWMMLYLWLQPVIDFSLYLEQWRMLFMLILIYPIMEEWLFRGLLQSWLMESSLGRKSVARFTLANAVTSIIFSAAHLFMHTLLWSMLVLFPSLIFGWMRDRYQSVRPAIALHIFYNSGYFLFFWP